MNIINSIIHYMKISKLHKHECITLKQHKLDQYNSTIENMNIPSGKTCTQPPLLSFLRIKSMLGW